MRFYRFHRTRLCSLGIPLVLVTGGFFTVSTFGVFGSRVPWIASSRHARKVNPLETNAASLAAGAKVYKAQCVACHGSSGVGDGVRASELDPLPSNLSAPSMWLQSDGELYYKTSKGRKPMPGFKKLISTEEIWQAVTYIRSLAPKPDVFGARFDVGEKHRVAISKVVAAFTACAMSDMTQAANGVAALTLEDQDKALQRLWKSSASKLVSTSGALAGASDGAAKCEALNNFTKALAYTLKLFGGVESGRLYQFSVPVSAASDDVMTWFQSSATPNSPYPNAGSKISKVAVFGPQTIAE